MRNDRGLCSDFAIAILAIAGAPLEGAGDLFDLEALDNVVFLDVLVVLEGHAAFGAFAHFADLVLEALQGFQAAFVDDDVVAQQPHLGAAPHQAFGDHAAGHLADLADIENFANLGVAEEALAPRRRQQARQGAFHVLDHLVDDRVVADLDAVAPRQIARLRIGTDVEADDHGIGRLGEDHVAFVDAADRGMQHAHRDLRRAEALERRVDRLERALHVRFDHDGEFLGRAGRDLREHLLERAAAGGGGGLLAAQPLPIFGDVARRGFAVDDDEIVAGKRRAGEAQHLHRRCRAGRCDGLAAIVDQGAYAAPFAAGDEDIAGLERAALDQHRRHRAAATFELGLDHAAFGRTIRIGLEVEHFGLQQNDFLELLEVGLLGRRNLDVEDVATQMLEHDFVLQQVLAHAVGLGVRLVDLVDGDDHRHFGFAGVADGLDRLFLDAVVGRDHQHDDVGDLCTARAHRRERLVTRRVDEGDALAVLERHLIGADMLGDAAGLAGDHVGRTQRVEQRRFAVVDVAHHGHHRRPRPERFRRIGLADQADFDVGFRDAAHLVAEFGNDELGGVGVDVLGDGRHHAHVEKLLDHLGALLGHAVGELLHGDGLGDHDLACLLDLRVRLVELLQALPLAFALAAELRLAARPLFALLVEGASDGELAALFRFVATRRDRRAFRAGAGTPRAVVLFFLDDLDLAGGRQRGHFGGGRIAGALGDFAARNFRRLFDFALFGAALVGVACFALRSEE